MRPAAGYQWGRNLCPPAVAAVPADRPVVRPEDARVPYDSGSRGIDGNLSAGAIQHLVEPVDDLLRLAPLQAVGVDRQRAVFDLGVDAG